MLEISTNNKIVVAGFDPPASCNLGWSVLSTDETFGNKTGRLMDAGVLRLPDDEPSRLLAIRDFLVDLVEKYDINVMCFERAIGNGMEAVRQMIGENTGVIKLVGASYGIKLVQIHTSRMALLFTGFGGGKDKNGLSKKTRTKKIARDIFYPDQSFKSIASYGNTECFEHQADSIGFCVAYLIENGVRVEGPGGIIESNTK